MRETGKEAFDPLTGESSTLAQSVGTNPGVEETASRLCRPKFGSFEGGYGGERSRYGGAES